jgi:hypothetical protein
LLDPHTGALAGRTSAVASVRRGTVTPIGADFGLRGLHRMKLTAPAGGWMVGDGGLVLTTSDLGNSWQTPAGLLAGPASRRPLPSLGRRRHRQRPAQTILSPIALARREP